MESKYFDKFTTLFKELGGSVVLRGNALLIEAIEEDEEIVTKGGIIIAQDPNQVKGGLGNDRPMVGLVLAVGEGYYDAETGKTTPLDIPVGAVVMHPPYSLTSMSTFPGMAGLTKNLGIIGENEVHFFYKDREAYKKARGLLNG